MGEHGRRVVAQKFSREVQLQRIEALYDKLLGERRGEAELKAENVMRENV